MAPTPTTTATPNDGTIKVSKKYKFFDSEFKLQTKEVEVAFTPAKDLAEATQRVNGDQSVMLKALNAHLQRMAFSEAKRSATVGGISRSVILAVLKPFRTMFPQFASMVDENATPEIKRKQKAAQTEAILELVKQSPVMMKSIIDASQAAPDSDEDDEEEND